MFDTPFFLFDATAGVDQWLSRNAWWMALIVAIILLHVVLILLFVKKPWKKNEKKAPRKAIVTSEYFAAMGGEENIVSHARKGSRIELKLKNYQAIDKEKLKEAGVDSFILMSDRLILVIQGDAEKVEKALFPEA